MCGFAAPPATYSFNLGSIGQQEHQLPRGNLVKRIRVIRTTNKEFQLVKHKCTDFNNQNLVTSRPCIGEQSAQIAKIRNLGGTLCVHIARQGLGTVREVIGQLWIQRIGKYGPNCYQD